MPPKAGRFGCLAHKDFSIAEEINTLSDGLCINLCGQTSLSEAIDLLACADTVVCNDSGLMHLAAALGRKLVAVYGSSSPDHTPPLSSRAQIVSLNLDCSPCFQRECPLGHTDCLNKLMPENQAASRTSACRCRIFRRPQHLSQPETQRRSLIIRPAPN